MLRASQIIDFNLPTQAESHCYKYILHRFVLIHQVNNNIPLKRHGNGMKKAAMKTAFGLRAGRVTAGTD